ncbi:entericidin A/B family lipoprotein [Litoreibacter janthinus]|uniref:Entericidin EcnA/B family protein n=1 Tax=Litoreibacter janthinus TaxID=670154 RepID=A0A1I6GC15_9RHOB|nr:entericidin A/B family lipoprotein [Litoreibacter janthinus]SFR39726.1 Entericidin EcnA/B family protein [Litoreibacter janthinus]
MNIIKIAAVFAFGALAACETIDGAGRDISTAGQVVSDTARDVQEDL